MLRCLRNGLREYKRSSTRASFVGFLSRFFVLPRRPCGTRPRILVGPELRHVCVEHNINKRSLGRYLRSLIWKPSVVFSPVHAWLGVLILR